MIKTEITKLTDIFCADLESLEKKGISTTEVVHASFNINTIQHNPKAKSFIYENIDKSIILALGKLNENTIKTASFLNISHDECGNMFVDALKQHANPIGVSFHTRTIEVLLDRN